MVATHCGKNSVMYRIVKSTCCTPKTNIKLYANCISVKNNEIKYFKIKNNFHFEFQITKCF